MRRLLFFIICVALASAANLAHAQFIDTLYSFCQEGACADGFAPNPSLVQGPSGDLYGSTYSGGVDVAKETAAGTLFKITLEGTLTVLHEFCALSNCSDSGGPTGVIFASDGNLYGTTVNSGQFGGGTVFKMTLDGALTTLHTFCMVEGCADGYVPSGSLLQASDGNFYGTTTSQGLYGGGTAYRITPSGTLTPLYSFCQLKNCADGSAPTGSLVQAADGALYGTTRTGGTNGYGTVFKMTLSGAMTTLYSFCSQKGTKNNGVLCLDGNTPTAGLVLADDGNLYGTTNLGGINGQDFGTIFRISTSGVLTTLYSFCSKAGCPDGYHPSATLRQASDGYLYGSNLLGGVAGGYGSGTLFRVTLGGTLTTLHQFCHAEVTNCADGISPGAILQTRDGGLYGTTMAGGAHSDGTIFKLTGVIASLREAASGEQADYFGRGRSGYTVWRPTTGYWYSIDGAGNSSSEQWGAPTDLPVIGDFDGDGKSDFAVFRPETGFWYVKRSSDQQIQAQQWGAAADLPVAGDFDGDGKTDIAVFRPSTGYWYIVQSSNGEVLAKQWGASSDTPVVGDFDGDGKNDVAVFRPSTGYWYIVQSSNGEVLAKQWGASTDIPVSGDFDGDGKTDIAVFRPSTRYWYIVQSSDGQVVSKQWGAVDDVPVARDYDGDGKTDIAVWRPSTGYWYVIQSGTGQTLATQWGAPTDIPVNNLGR